MARLTKVADHPVIRIGGAVSFLYGAVRTIIGLVSGGPITALALFLLVLGTVVIAIAFWPDRIERVISALRSRPGAHHQVVVSEALPITDAVELSESGTAGDLSLGVDLPQSVGATPIRRGPPTDHDEWVLTWRDFRVTNTSQTRRLNIDVQVIHTMEHDGQEHEVPLVLTTREEMLPIPGGWPTVGTPLEFPLRLEPEDTARGILELRSPFFRGPDGPAILNEPERVKLRIIDYISERWIELPLMGGRYP